MPLLLEAHRIIWIPKYAYLKNKQKFCGLILPFSLKAKVASFKSRKSSLSSRAMRVMSSVDFILKSLGT